ncbi:hypothetical protein ACQSED_13000 [Salmonella enterica]|uniref:hypothetical protein n=1 Tax=Salmonella enterica TaxID=28901 RepID=UPI003D318EF9
MTSYLPRNVLTEKSLSGVNDASETFECSAEQLERLGFAIFRVAKSFDADTGVIEVSGICYIVDIKNKSPRTIAEMNHVLADAVCDDPVLDSCNLTARFSPQRTLHW